MKKLISTLCLAFFLITGLQLSSCAGGSDSNSPVAQYVELLEKATKQIEGISNLEELKDVQRGVESQQATTLLLESKDYVLTDSDKEKLKKATDKMLKAVFDKSIELSGLEEDMKKTMKDQSELAIEAVNKNIDKATTLGQINGLM